MPGDFQERRRQRPFRIVYIPLDAVIERFILRKQAAPEAPPAPDRPVQPPAPASEKAAPWTCGVARLDEKYEVLFQVIRQYQGALKSGAAPGAMEEVLTSLCGHVDGHLALEEAYLEKIGFPGLEEHRKGHQAFRHQVHAFHRRISDRDPSAGLECSQLLFAWLRLHVMREDPVWSEFAKARRR